MKLQSKAPPAVLQSIRTAGATEDQVVLSVASDINLLGEYAPQWLLAGHQHVAVVDERVPHTPIVMLAMSECQEFRTIGVVGSGLLQVKVGGMWLDLLRFSNRMKYHFGRLAKRLEQLRTGESFELTDVDEYDPRRCRTCGLMLDFEGETCPRCINRGRAMSRIFQLMRPYWGAAALMMFLLLASLSLAMINPYLTQFLIDVVLTKDPQATSLPLRILEGLAQRELLLLVVGAVALVAILQALINIFNGRLGSRVGTAITFDIRGRLVNRLEQLSLSYYDKQSVGSLVGRVAYDTEAVQGFMGQLTGGFLMQILMVIFSAFFMVSLSPKLAMWTLLPAPFVLSGTFIFYRFVYPHYEKFWDRSAKQAGMLNGLLSGIRVVKAFAQEDRELERFQKSSATLRDARRKVDTSAATFYPIMGLIFSMGGWVIWYVGGQDVLLNNLDPDRGMTLGKLMRFFGYMGMFYGPLNQLTHLTSWLTHFTTQVHRIFEVLDTPISIVDPPQPTPLPVMNGEIQFQAVTFGYSRQNPILKNVSFHIQPGQTIGIVGHSGSGKTTIINLISRFYDVDEGEIFIDGVEIRRIASGDLRRQIGVVLQEPFLFRGTLWENLVYGRINAGIEEVIAASRAGNSHDFIMRQIYGYDTWVGERGAGLSGGERQRLSISRALLCEPRILILDEATSSVDSESELAIQQALAELVKGRTSIIIAHRLSTLRNCDRILVIHEGRLVEEGNHHELMKLDGKYAKLVRIQTSVSKSTSVDDLEVHARDQELEKREIPEVARDPDTGLTPLATHHPRWLTPQVANIHLGNHGALHVTIRNERIYNGVYALRCMPVRYPARYLSLRWINAENRDQEIGLIRDLYEWPAAAQQLVRQALLRRYFVHNIQAIESVKNRHNYLYFKVRTDVGPMEFVMRWSHSTAQDYGHRGKILLDVEENRYLIPDISQLPPNDQRLFERYIYW